MEENQLYVKLNIQRFATHLQTWGTYSFGTNNSSWNGWYDGNGRVKVYLESQSLTNNSSYIRIDHYIVLRTDEIDGGMEAYNINSSYRANQGSQGGSYQSITGSKSTPIRPVSGQAYEYLLGSTYHTVYHNSDGTGRLYVNGSITATLRERNEGHSFTATRSSSFNVQLPTIPRYANITSFSIWQTGLNSIAGSVRADRAIDHIQYSLNGGTWTNCNQDFSITGLNPNTQYNVRTRVKSTASQLWTESGYAYATTLNIATLTSVPSNIDIENPFTFTIARNGASDVSIGIYDTAGAVAFAPYRLVSGTSYTFELTEAEKTAIFNDMSTVNSKTYRIFLNTNSNAYRTTVDRTFNVVNANPTFSNFEYEDTGGDTLIPEVKTTDLTGNNQTIIKGYSNLRARVTAANKMIANKGANPIEYQLVVGSKQIKANYSSSTDVDLSLNAIDNNVFILYAIDSRGNSTNVQKSPEEYIDYFRPVINDLVINRENNISTFVNLSFTGTFFNVDFGAEINEITAKYQYRNTKSDEWIIGDTDLTLDISDNNFSFNNSIAGDLDAEGFSITESFEIKVIIEDLLSTNEKSEILVSATPNLSMHQDGTAINNQYDDSLDSGVQLNGNNIYYNGMLLFGWSDELPIAMKNEEEIMEIESEEKDEKA